MSSSFDIPDSISFGELEKLQAKAAEEMEERKAQDKSGPFGGLNEEAVCDLVNDKLQEIQDACPNPIAHKVAMLQIISNMVEWHVGCAERQIEDGDIVSAGNWMRDAGKFQALHNILQTISVCKDDFTMDD